MSKNIAKKKIVVKNTTISIIKKNESDYISLTDMIKSFGDETVIYNWMRNRNTVEFLGIWELINNLDFKPIEFDRFKKEAGLNSFTLSPKKWVETTNAIGIISKSGRYGGTFAHKDIAFEFGSWLSPEFKLYLITEFQRLKEEESRTKSLEWSIHRTLTKINYRIHTDAIKENLIPPDLTKKQITFIYANEADLLNVAIFGKTATEWKFENSDKKGNMRDYATIEQLVILSNIESINTLLIGNGLQQSERLQQLNTIAKTQMQSIINNPAMKNFAP